MRRRIAPAAAVVLSLVGIPFSANAGEQPLQKGDRMIARCLEYANSHQYPPMSSGVVDPTGTLVAFKRQDGAAPATADAALLKARTALRVGAPTAALVDVAGDPPTRDTFLLLQMTTLPGGIPFFAGDGRIEGAFGVSGGTAEQDAECARQAIEIPPVKK